MPVNGVATPPRLVSVNESPSGLHLERPRAVVETHLCESHALQPHRSHCAGAHEGLLALEDVGASSPRRVSVSESPVGLRLLRPRAGAETHLCQSHTLQTLHCLGAGAHEGLWTSEDVSVTPPRRVSVSESPVGLRL